MDEMTDTASTLTGKTAIVTGASSGIGEATARLLAAKGCNVVLAARREDRLESLTPEIGEKTFAVPTDVTDPSACAALTDRALERFSSLDVLVNNAGLCLYGSIAEADPEDWRRMFDVRNLAPGTSSSFRASPAAASLARALRSAPHGFAFC